MTLDALAADAATCRAAARLAEHADGAGDAAAARHWAPIAAREAVARGAHRQAAAQWQRALRHIDAADERAAALDALAVELHMSSGLAPAIAARREASRLWQGLGMEARAVESLAELALMHVLGGRAADARTALGEALALAAAAGPAEQARVQACAACLALHDGDLERVVVIATEALRGTEPHADPATIALNLKSLGTALLQTSRVDEGLTHLERSMALAAVQHDDKGVAQAFASLAAGCLAARRLDLAAEYLSRGIDFCAERDLDAPRLHQVATLAHLRLLRGQWDEAATAADEVIDDRRATAIARASALTALGRLRARRGDSGVWAALDEARDLAAGAGTTLRLNCARVRAEAAWLEGRDADAACEAGNALPHAIERRLSAPTADLLLWCHLGGDTRALPAFCADEPAVLEAAGHWREAADAWTAAGCPFEAARALAGGGELPQRHALAVFDALGARPMVERLRHLLRSAGVRSVPHGPRASTKEHPAGLTSTEVTVLALLGTGLRSKEIAARLHRSPRTVDHHLQAIFGKLDVATRAEAVGVAIRLGLAGQPG
jgi:DNA-binding CsgD family transcriptional regulator